MRWKARFTLWMYRNHITERQYDVLRNRIKAGESERALKTLAQLLRRRYPL